MNIRSQVLYEVDVGIPHRGDVELFVKSESRTNPAGGCWKQVRQGNLHMAVSAYFKNDGYAGMSFEEYVDKLGLRIP